MNRRIIFGALLAMAFLLAPTLLQARWMDAKTGRFQTIDPYEGNLEIPQSLHKYSYAHNDPVNNVDPSGQAVYFVLRKFATPGAGTWFQYKLAEMGHGYLLFTVPGDPGEGDPLTHGYNALTTCSWHPSSWDYAEKAGAYDATTKTPGRVWINHPEDMLPKTYSIYLITKEDAKQKALLGAINNWMLSNPVGYERGEPQNDDDNRDHNEVGDLYNRQPAPTNGVYYSLLEQNCVWWATVMPMQNGISLPPKAAKAVSEFNHGFGVANDVIAGHRSANDVYRFNDAPKIKGIGGYDIDMSLPMAW